MITIPTTYHKGSPPSYTTEFDISLGIRIYSILELSDLASEMAVKFMITMRWRDPRLSYNNLREDRHRNRVIDVKATEIWYPRIIFLNTDKRAKTKVTTCICLYHNMCTYC